MFTEPMLASPVTEKKRATLASPKYILEPKHDGMRATLSKHNGEVKIYSRVGLEYQEHLPRLVEQASQLPDGTTLDGELMVVKKWTPINGIQVPVADFNNTMRVMGANPDKAIFRQTEHPIEFCVFDVLSYNGQDYTGDSYATRMYNLQILLDLHPMPFVFQNARIHGWNDNTIQDLWEAGIEGAILKNQDSIYIPGKRRANTWYKVKAELTADVVVVGFTDANEGKTGKFKGKIGAIRFGAYDEQTGLIVEIGQCSGMNDAERDRWTAIRDSGEVSDPFTPKRVIEVKYNDLVGSSQYGTPRHPQFKTERIDKNPEDCSLEQFLLAPTEKV